MPIHIFSTRALSLAICAGALLLAACDSGQLSAPPESQAPALAPVDFNASVSKVDVCHRTTTGDYTKISIADAAYDTHIDHGDGGVFTAVPGNEAYIFGSDCQPIFLDYHCPCYPTAEDLGDLQNQGSGVYWTDGAWNWSQTLSLSDTSPAQASVSGDHKNGIGTCSITQSDGTGKAYSPIRLGDANECKNILDLNNEVIFF